MTSVAIVGVGQTNYRRSHPDKSSRELIWEAARKALDDASMEIDSIDAIFAGVAPDALAGEASVERTAMMGIGKPFLRINTGGVTGSSTVFAGATSIRAGRAKAVLVVGLERMGQATTSQQVFNTIFDPVYEKDFPLTTITMAALRASMLMRLYGYTERHWAEIASRSFRNALKNPHAHLKLDVSPEDVLRSPLLSWPIHRYEACPMSEGACAMVLVAWGNCRRSHAGLDPGRRLDVRQLCHGRPDSPARGFARRSALASTFRRAGLSAGGSGRSATANSGCRALLGVFQCRSDGLSGTRPLPGRGRPELR